ncbi:MAG TPA: RNA polymerase sigma factor [Candidatus Aminicenantes bacterium]|nr:RNA polymerase sigma factor [Candidatus Aminicenantes bacterium]
MDLNELIRECQNGRPGAWEMLVNSYSKKIFNMAYQFTGSYEQAEDATQEIFIKLFHSLRKFDFDRNFTAWLLTMTKNHLIDDYRRTRRERTQRDDYDEHYLCASPAENPENRLFREEERKKIWEKLDLLSPELRMTLILRDIQGRSYEEIAGIMSLPLGTVKSRVNRARLQLAGLLRPDQKGDKA